MHVSFLAILSLCQKGWWAWPELRPTLGACCQATSSTLITSYKSLLDYHPKPHSSFRIFFFLTRTLEQTFRINGHLNRSFYVFIWVKKKQTTKSLRASEGFFIESLWLLLSTFLQISWDFSGSSFYLTFHWGLVTVAICFFSIFSAS